MSAPADPPVPSIKVGDSADPPPAREVVRRHTRVTRVTHWINVLAFVLLLMSGLQIFNAHPALYWGKTGTEFEPAFISLRPEQRPGGIEGVTRIGPLAFETTGVLGVSGPDRQPSARGFPAWATIPGGQDLASGRRWHFFFAWVLVLNGLLYLGANLLNGDLRRKLWPRLDELRHIGHSVWEHARFRWPQGQEAKKYNVLQKLTYLVVILGLFPLVVLTGTTMSPGLNAAFPFMLDVFGGRQSARTIHFIAASLLVAFLLIHVFLVLISGVWNNMRSMITGRYVIEERAAPDAP